MTEQCLQKTGDKRNDPWCSPPGADGSGTEAVNVKSLAAELGCSTQPIYLSFDNMDALRKELIPTAVNKFVELMQKECGSTRVHLTASSTFVLPGSSRNCSGSYS